MSATDGSAPSGTARPWRRAALWLAFLAPFFYATYGLANWLASLRAHVPAIVFDWEHDIPFIGWTIIPYWSINAFYGLSVFVCRTNDELDTIGRRLLTAQVIAVTCFILFPLRFTFAPPETAGVSGFLFATLASFDLPFNQAPSLHVAILAMLWVHYTRIVPRWSLWLLHPWYVLVGGSVLTTYQHHFIDIPTGALLGFMCLWIWPDRRPAPPSIMHWTSDSHRLVLAERYAAGALAIAVLALWIGGAALWLLWPAWSLLMVAANYALFGHAGFQKGPDGRMSIAARVLLAPFLVGVFANSRVWTRHSPAPADIGDGVALGRFPDCATAAKFPTIVDLCAELPHHCEAPQWRAFPMLDLVRPEPQTLATAAAVIEEARSHGPVLVSCALGYSRSAATVATWLVRYGKSASVSEAIEHIRLARPRIYLSEAAVDAIAQASKLGPNHE